MSPLIKRLSWALALSVGLNLFLLGFGAARAWRMQDGHHGPKRAGLMRVLGAPSAELRAQHEALASARAEVVNALKAEPYDRARTERALSVLRERAAHGQLLLHRRLLERADELPATERRQLAEQRWLPGPPSPPPHR